MKMRRSNSKAGFALLALILYLGGLIVLCLSSFSAYTVVQQHLVGNQKSLYGIQDLARLCAEEIAARFFYISPNPGFLIHLYGHRCIFEERRELSANEILLVVRLEYFEHLIRWWIVITADGGTIVRERI